MTWMRNEGEEEREERGGPVETQIMLQLLRLSGIQMYRVEKIISPPVCVCARV